MEAAPCDVVKAVLWTPEPSLISHVHCFPGENVSAAGAGPEIEGERGVAGEQEGEREREREREAAGTGTSTKERKYK